MNQNTISRNGRRWDECYPTQWTKLCRLTIGEMRRKRKREPDDSRTSQRENRMESGVIDIGILPETLISQKRKNALFAFSICAYNFVLLNMHLFHIQPT